MPAVKKTITLMDMRCVNGNPEHSFKVVKLQNSIKFRIGEHLNEDRVKNMCMHGVWTVNITPYKRT